MTYEPILTIADADSINEDIYGNEAWFALEDSTKEVLISNASMLVDLFLRSNGLTRESIDLDSLAFATAYQAFFVYQNKETINRAMKENIEGIKEQTLGSITVQKESGFFKAGKMYSPMTLTLLRPYLRSGIKMVRA